MTILDYYILDGHTPVAVEYWEWMEWELQWPREHGEVFDARQRVGRTEVPIPPRLKCPVLTDWQHLRLEEQELDNHFGDDTNIGLLLGEPSGGLVDVDCDCAEAKELAEKLLPETPAVTGRGGNPRSHRW